MRTTILLWLALALTLPTNAQVKKVKIPDIPGYVTLKGDFHIHTVFSDGNVWPTVRIDEAVAEGVDVIAITDHIEYRPHLSDIPSDHNRSYDIAKPEADKNNIILVKGTEITRSMPPGHFNALFISDAAALAKDDFKAVVKEAKKHGAFIIWNHPGWKAQQPDTTKWWDIHTWLYDNQMLNGIEIYNEKEYYPIVFDWAIQKKITIFANSDIHGPTSPFYNIYQSHRPLTLVFAKERNEVGVKDALFDGRSVAFTDNMVRGKEEWLKPLFEACIKVVKKGSKTELTNLSGIDFELEDISGSVAKTISLQGEGSAVITSSKPIKIKVKNFEISPDKYLEVTL